MKPGQTVRVTCYECLTAFDIKLAPSAEWPEMPMADDDDEVIDMEIMKDAECPFCGAQDLRVQAQAPALVGGGRVRRKSSGVRDGQLQRPSSP